MKRKNHRGTKPSADTLAGPSRLAVPKQSQLCSPWQAVPTDYMIYFLPSAQISPFHKIHCVSIDNSVPLEQKDSNLLWARMFLSSKEQPLARMEEPVHPEGRLLQADQKGFFRPGSQTAGGSQEEKGEWLQETKGHLS